MSWLCDVCGYENEFNDESQPTTCLCCGEVAPESKIIKARRELEAYHREEERKALIEELRKKQELHRQTINRIVTKICRIFKAIPVAAVALVMISFVWVGVSLHSEGMTMSAWNKQMHFNINTVFLTGYPDKLRNNAIVLDISKKMLVPLKEAGKVVTSKMCERFSAISENFTTENEICVSDYPINIDKLNKSASVRNNYLSDNALIILESVGSDLKQIGKQAPTIGQKITSSSANVKLNWSVFWYHAKDNVQELINMVIRRER